MPPDRLILAFDTSAAHCAAALVLSGKVLISVQEPMAKGQAERLVPLLEEVLASAVFGWRDLGAIAVGVGPGNFTGIRIAVAAARGLALGLNIPAIGVTQFEALAHGQPRPLLVVEDARRGMVYVQGFGTLPADAAVMPVEAAKTFLHAAAVTGGGAALITDAPALPPAMPVAEAIAHVAAMKPGDGARPAPFYLRAADAAPSRDPGPVILDDA
ncbi:tRNA (adenosine(37)-N6)-threonylcarbamoyltransferase complex dimerization subunit type 1 TsaB [Pseudorhodobacter sp.]|uniref:tRNA (adenosine(37)-N6)-threonylcarbamoyltransferase complex dimerization subunit type 1 TsaB n=1 Tax=Pseudorhodobacter sp. TaxID=1934400 RepID=UPI002649961D|nr:tRNA (adenosine(37)-N6)-threonylcarbamoyltransferase complex dimerization subunit type 1 TsaB [Pseudorhodobacter sp.]MDN5787726.1 tRNA (adenosine(37)-N6)-threonylcarbamoyltransferase complex dimerization subunit type 1 TsaB [Pseudorhodobacter sp.]